MARMPGVTWAPANDTNSGKTMKQIDIVCVHTIVGHDPAVAAHFSTGSDGKITQSRDTINWSAANFDGNWHIIAIENEDMGSEYGNWNTNNGHDVPGFTAAQKEAIAQVIAWACMTHNIPIELVPDSKVGRRGIGYHRQGIDGNYLAEGFAYGGRVSGGERWSDKTGKVCPGDRRITELINEIIPRARVLAGLEEDDVSFTDKITVASPGDRAYTETDEAARFIGDAYFWGSDTYKAMMGTVLPQLATLTAAITNGELDAETVMTRMETAVKDATNETITNVVLPALKNVLQDFSDALDGDQIDAIVDEISNRLKPAA